MYEKERAEMLIKRHKTRDPFVICDALNITLLYADLENDIKGFYQYYKRKRIIQLNANIVQDEWRAVLAHEIGHVILHKDYNCMFLAGTYLTKNKYERQANIFASELLLPDIPDRDYWDYSIDQLAAVYCVPVELVKLKYKI